MYLATSSALCLETRDGRQPIEGAVFLPEYATGRRMH